MQKKEKLLIPMLGDNKHINSKGNKVKHGAHIEKLKKKKISHWDSKTQSRFKEVNISLWSLKWIYLTCESFLITQTQAGQ